MKKYRDKCWLNQKYIVEQLSPRGIAELCEVGGTTIFDWLKRYNIPMRTVSEAKKLWYKNHPGIRKGKNHPCWKGGRKIDSEGYIQVYQPNHFYAQAGGYVREHRLVMEKILGRILLPEEIVHHNDKDKANNLPGNLKYFPSQAEHTQYEHELKRSAKANS